MFTLLAQAAPQESFLSAALRGMGAGPRILLGLGCGSAVIIVVALIVAIALP
jgi:hypothetical protein